MCLESLHHILFVILCFIKLELEKSKKMLQNQVQGMRLGCIYFLWEIYMTLGSQLSAASFWVLVISKSVSEDNISSLYTMVNGEFKQIGVELNRFHS